MKNIRFSEPYIPTKAAELLGACLQSGLLSGDGPFCTTSEHQIKQMVGAEHVLLTTSCTHALELACAMVDGSLGDEILVPSFTFTSSATAIIQAGFVPVFVDVDPSTMNIDPADVMKAITTRTRAIMVVHYAGVACDMAALRAICDEHGLLLIEDAAHAFGGRWNDLALGTLGNMAAYSFHATKNITCGEGGAFLTSSAAIAERAEIFREKGTNRKQFFRGQVDKYRWVSKGSSYVLAEPLAAMLSGSLTEFEMVQSIRRTLIERYRQRLSDSHLLQHITLPSIPSYARPAWHLQHIFLASEKHRSSLIRFLGERGVGTAFHYVPLHTSPMGLKCGAPHRALPVTEDVADWLLRLPLHTNVTVEDVDRIADLITQWVREQ